MWPRGPAGRRVALCGSVPRSRRRPHLHALLHPLHMLLARALNHLLPLGGRGIVPPVAQHLPPLRRKLLETPEVLADSALFVGRQGLKPLPPIAQRLPLLWR